MSICVQSKNPDEFMNIHQGFDYRIRYQIVAFI